MLKFIRKWFNRRKSSASVHEVSCKSYTKKSSPNEKRFRYSSQPRRFDIELSSQDDEDSCCEDVASSVTSFPKGVSENDEMIEMKSDDRARRQEIIEALIAFGVISYDEGRQISDTPYVRLCSGGNAGSSSPRCKGFVLVNNFLRFPSYMNFSGCFVDYLNYRCQSGEILSRLLARKVFLEDDDDLENGNEHDIKWAFK